MADDDYEARVTQLRLERLNKFNDDMERELSTVRVPALAACKKVVEHVKTTPDYLNERQWQLAGPRNTYLGFRSQRHAKRSGGGCVIS